MTTTPPPDDGLAAGADLYETMQAVTYESVADERTRLAAAITDASLPTLRVAHSLLYDEVFSEQPRRGTTVRRQMVLTEIRRREIQPT